MKQLFILTNIIILATISLFGQRGTITGSVIDEKEKQKLVYVSAFLFDAKDSSFVKAELTDASGVFKFDMLYNGNYYIQLYYAMYDKWFSDTIKINSDLRNVSLGEILLIPQTHMLKGADIVYMKPLYEEKPGKLIMNVESHPSAAGDNLFELLRKTPSVTIDNDENILINGKSGANLLINNRSSHLSGDELINFLKTTPAATVDKIEVINTPSSKYDADGSAGMINIQLKKDDNFGVNGNVWASGSLSRNYGHSEGVNLNFRVGKLILSTNYNYNLNTYSHGSRSKTSYIRKDGSTSIITSNEKEEEFWGSESRNSSNSYSFNAEYQLDKKNSFGVTYRGGISNRLSENKNYTRVLRNNFPDSSYCRVSNNQGLNNRNYVSAFYRHDFDTANTNYFEVDFDYSRNNSESDNHNTFDYYQGDFEQMYNQSTRRVYKYPQLSENYVLEAYYEKEQGEFSFESGVKSSLSHNNDRSVNYINSTQIGSSTNHFDYLENISGGYFSISTKLDDITYLRAGLRGELSYVKGKLISTGENNSSLYFDVFPNINFDLKLPKKNKVSLSYRSRISRPRFYNLNPFVDVSEQLSISTGNPLLKPEYSHNFSLGYSWNYMLFFNVGYYYTLNEVDYTRVLNPNTGIATRFPQNIGKNQGLNGSVSFFLPVRKWWNMNLYFYSSYGRSVFTYQNKIEQKIVYYNGIHFSQNFNFLKIYSFEMSGYYNLPSQGEWGKTKNALSLNAGFKARFFKKDLTLSLSVNNILNNGSYSWNYLYPDGSTAEGYSIWNTTSLSLRVSYRFGKQFEMKKKAKNGEIENGNGGSNGGTPSTI